ncbi:Methyl-accepting chemotaxis sensor/transducer protein [hydrothermal vent metagenome]|uniref:Methyl-accepting chemotaxis sensor/transducer protein n=1 Tax=hydrothermal vent metagenome TaxID=652676 RepID=A0A3B0YTY0_9ZZZZ
MKTNLPVSDKEKHFGEDVNLITTTCRKGSITFSNDEFREISGFSDEEMLNKNHNLVRHPDMPAEAFDDLWKTIKNRKSWMGIVKNRCKSGDHYYVDTYVTPIVENGDIVEYQSVRTKPERIYVERAEKIYRRIRNGKKAFRRMFQFGFTSRIMAGISTMLFACLAIALSVGQISWLQAGITSFVGLSFSYGMARLIAQPIIKLGAKARSIYDNDLSCMIYEGSLDEVAKVNLALHVRELEVNSVIARLKDSTDKLKDVVSDISEIVDESTSSSNTQKIEIEQLSTAMNEMSSTVQEVARNTAEGATAAQTANEQANIGKQDVSSTIAVVKEVSEEMNQAAEVVRKLQTESESIGAVLDVIRGVAEKTNLLALNAAIEAARAGEQGRGFAVVADEVRTLASRTQNSTQEIQLMIESVQKGAHDAMGTMDKGCDRVEFSVQQAEKAGSSLESITEVVSSITNMNNQVATATEEQSSVTEEINRNVSNINYASELNAELSIKMQNTNNELSVHTNQLQSLILQFQKK